MLILYEAIKLPRCIKDTGVCMDLWSLLVLLVTSLTMILSHEKLLLFFLHCYIHLADFVFMFFFSGTRAGGHMWGREFMATVKPHEALRERKSQPDTENPLRKERNTIDFGSSDTL